MHYMNFVLHCTLFVVVVLFHSFQVIHNFLVGKNYSTSIISFSINLVSNFNQWHYVECMQCYCVTFLHYCITNCVTVYRSVILISLNWGVYSVLRLCIGSGSMRGFLKIIMKCNSTCLNVERFIPHSNS